MELGDPFPNGASDNLLNCSSHYKCVIKRKFCSKIKLILKYAHAVRACIWSSHICFFILHAFCVFFSFPSSIILVCKLRLKQYDPQMISPQQSNMQMSRRGRINVSKTLKNLWKIFKHIFMCTLFYL
uniref:Uncharacterized protein n=1 Tax=Pyxicephalus adspersus TaxID=30357 RepID=A0AAV2ZHM5_PYXAD|nr:TPA: hypothetical protein GDO54_002375 [Pyxicephalus adspersus]